MAGQYTVMISAFRPASAAEIAARRDSEETAEKDEEPAEDEKPAGGEAAAVPANAPTTQYLPPKYNQASELSVELAAGANEAKDFDLMQ